MTHGRVILAGSLGCCACSAAGPAPCAELVSQRDRYDLYHVVTLPDGYVIDDRGALVGFGLDDVERFRVPSSAFAFARARGDELVAMRTSDGDVIVTAWSRDGVEVGELGRLDELEPLEPSGGAILADGSILAYGVEPEYWTGHVSAGGPGTVVRSADEEPRAAAPAAGTDAYVLHTTSYDPLHRFERLQLSRIGAGDVPAWTTTVFDRPDDSSPLQLGADLLSAGDDAFVVTYVSDEYVIRRYSPDGELQWTHTVPFDPYRPPGLPITRPDGTLVWLDHQDDDIRVRFLDEAGETTCEATIPNDGSQLSDVDAIGDELFVVTIDRLTRIQLADPPPE